ncbi:MAG: NAD(P)/FAD-dependent oxidoreductase [Candidatus Eisenbacteria bacterium]|nr:NAD(P)/FAD-dependent oxidoreductase [Candidatus Eisenbacteria bacterium]
MYKRQAEEILPDRERFAGLSVAVVGGGDSACLDALELAPIAREVHLISRSPALRARTDIQRAVLAEPKIERWSGWEIRALAGTDPLESMTIAEAASRIGGAVTDPTGTRDSAGAAGASLLREIAVDAIVVKIGFAPNTEAFRDKIACNEAGEVLADRGGRTNVPGVFAIGDVVAGSVWRVAAAVGSGVTVVPAIQQHLSSLLG